MLECEYNDENQCIKMTYGHESGATSRYVYDKDGNTVLELEDTVPRIAHIYQEDKLYCAMNHPGSTHIYEYDHLGRVCKETVDKVVYTYKYSDETTNITSCLKDGELHWTRKYVMEANRFCQYLNGKLEVSVPIGGELSKEI